jgi:predicted MFS family arabinose efflux permease
VVSLLEFCAGLPWLLFGLSAGVFADRWDRRGLMWRADLIRLGLVALLAVLLAAGAVSVPILLAMVFLLATVGTLFSSAAPALLPSVVPGTELHRANARLAAGRTSGENFVGPPAGALLFGVLPWLPFAVDALTFGGSAWCVRGLPRTVQDDQPEALDAPRAGIRHEVLAGIGWLWRVRTLRMLAISGSLLALATSAFLAIFVLFVLEVLRLPAVGYGVLISLFAVGSLGGSLVSSRVVVTLGLRWTTQVSAVVGAVAFCLIGATSWWPVAAAALVVFGGAVGVWNTTAVTIRQNLTPTAMLGRISSRGSRAPTLRRRNGRIFLSRPRRAPRHRRARRGRPTRAARRAGRPPRRCPRAGRQAGRTGPAW